MRTLTRKFVHHVFLFALTTLLLTGCPAELQDLIDSTRSSLNEESGAYQLLVDIPEGSEGVALKRLEDWNSALRRLATNLRRVINHFDAVPKDRAKADDHLQQLKEKLDVILDRHVDFTLSVPSWELRDTYRETENVQENLQKVKTGYETLFNLTVPETAYHLRAQEDPSIVDARPLCLERFQVATLGDIERDTCLSVAYSVLSGCTHRMDLSCVDTLLLNAQTERFVNGSMCARIFYKEIDNPETGEHRVIRETMPLPWLDHIRNCETSTLLRR